MKLLMGFLALFFGVDLLYQAAQAFRTGKATYRLKHYTREGTPKDFRVFITYCMVAGLFFLAGGFFMLLQL